MGNTVIPRLTSDPANEFFAVFRTRLTNVLVDARFKNILKEKEKFNQLWTDFLLL